MKRLDKAYNEFMILDTIKTRGEVTIPAIAAYNGLSRPTVDVVVHQLEEQGMVIQAGYAESEIGRKPVMWKLNGKSGYFIGLDFEYPVVRICVLDLTGQVVHSATHQMPGTFEPDDVIARLEVVIERCITETLGGSMDTLKYICVGNPGTIDHDKGLSLTLDNALAWSNVPIVSILRKRFQCHVDIQNVILYMAYVERDKYVSMGKLDYVFISHRKGVGAGLCINGEMYSGTMGNAGHIGFIPTEHLNSGCGRNLGECSDVRMMTRRMSEYGLMDISQYDETSFSTKWYDILTDEAEKDNPAALRILDEIAEYWAFGVAASLYLLDIPVFIFGGMMAYVNQRSAKTGAYFLERLNEYCDTKYCNIRRRALDLNFSEHVTYSAAFGAALFGYDAFFTNSEMPLALGAKARAEEQSFVRTLL